MNEIDRRALGYGVIALIAVFTIYLNVIPVHDLASELSQTDPAAGWAEVSARPSAAPEGDVVMSRIFDSENACESETNRPCEWVLCEGDIDNLELAQKNIGEMREQVCSAGERTGWRPTSIQAEKTMTPPIFEAGP